MRGEIGSNVERALDRLWQAAGASVPEWLPMRHVEWLPLAYEVTARFVPARRGRSNVYLVLLDYGDSAGDPHGVYVGMSRYPPLQRFEQHKAGIRAAGSVLQARARGADGTDAAPAGHPAHRSSAHRGGTCRGAAGGGLCVQGGH